MKIYDLILITKLREQLQSLDQEQEQKREQYHEEKHISTFHWFLLNLSLFWMHFLIHVLDLNIILDLDLNIFFTNIHISC